MSEAATLSDVSIRLYQNSFDRTGATSNLDAVMDGIKSGKWRKQVEQVRNEADTKKRNALKQRLPAFTPSGVFSERKSSGLQSHSGRLAIDFDLQDNPELETSLEAVRENLQKDKYSECVSSSVSGQGLFVIVKIDGDQHAESFEFLQAYYQENYELCIDKSCKDVSRLRFVSYDPKLHYNENAETVIVPDAEDFGESTQEDLKAYPSGQSNNKSIMEAIIKSGKMIGDDGHPDWTKVGFVLAHEFGEAGRSYFHALSQRSSKYDEAECDRKYDNCLRTNRGDVTFATIIHMAKVAGIELPKTRRLVNSELTENVLSNERLQVKAFNLTDLGNARRLVSLYGDKIRYCFAWKKWLIWDGKSWSVDDDGQIIWLGKETVKRIYQEAAGESDFNARSNIARWALRSEEEKKIKAMISLAQSEEGIPISPDELDGDPHLLNCLNGTLDLRTGDLMPHNPKDFITKMIPVEYHPKAECPTWLEFLETVFNFNYDIIRFLQRAVGYSLTGSTSEQCLFLLHGSGANGKSTFVKTVINLLGDFAQIADFETFLIRGNDGGIRNDLARMKGKRFISAVEMESGKRLAETVIKQLTGGDIISARFLFAEYFDFSPTFKIWLAANHKPNIRGTDHAIWRRIKLIPFNVTIPDEKQDKGLDEKLKAELPGILAWAVQGCLEWKQTGLQTPEEVKNATSEYRNEMDTIQAFFDECCIINTEVKAKAGVLYESYKKWCTDNNEFTLNNRQFGRRLNEKGFQSFQSSGNWWRGIGVKSENS
ncbi:MAG: phage/plasmid primase, P4 family [Candidatus Jettenia sp.]|nr:MAG: phage/plasmid primase, P4 family [Candidatus Jettenia sp.]